MPATTHISDSTKVTETEEANGIQRLHLSFVGDVDDPIFRYSAKVSANHAGVTGWISKTVAGFADVCIQGTAEQIKYYKRSILRRAHSHGLLCSLAGSEELAPVDNERDFSMKMDFGY